MAIDYVELLRNFSGFPSYQYDQDEHRWTPQESMYWEILRCNQASDARQGVVTKILRDLQGKFLCVRDGRQVPTPDEAVLKECDKYSYLAMAMNYAIACMNLIEVQEKDEDGNLQENFKQIPVAVETLKNTILIARPEAAEALFLYFVEHVLKGILQEAGISDQGDTAHIKLLDKIKNWSALELPPMHLITLEKLPLNAGGYYEAVRHDIPLAEPASWFEDQHGDVDGKQRDGAVVQGEQQQQKQGFQLQGWYTAMSDQEKKIYRHYRPKILEGRVLPSQLRKKGGPPGIKNWYLHRGAVYDRNDYNKPKKTWTFGHHGSWVGLNKDNEQIEKKTTSLSVQQWKDLVTGDKKLQHSVHYEFILNAAMRDKVVRCKDSVASVCHYLGCLLSCGIFCKKPYWHPDRLEYFDQTIVSRVRAAVDEEDNNTRVDVEEKKTSNAETGSEDAMLVPVESSAKTGETKGSPKLFVSDVAINGWRRLQGVEYSSCCPYGIQKGVMQQMLADVDNVLFRVNGLQGNQYYNNKILPLSDKLVQMQNALRERFHRCAFRRDRNNNALYIVVIVAEISAMIEKIKHQLLESGILPEDVAKLQSSLVWFGCASGENRTGILLQQADVEIICNDLLELDAFAVMRQFAASGHLHRLMEFQGSNAGTGYVRKKSAGALSKNQQGVPKTRRKENQTKFGYSSALFRKTANLKSVANASKSRSNGDLAFNVADLESGLTGAAKMNEV